MVGHAGRWEHLEQRFVDLAGRIPESAEREAISVLHAMIQELGRTARPEPPPAHGATIDDIASLYESAPKMEAPAANEPLPVGSEAPDFALPDATNEIVRLSDHRGRPVVLVFYPLDWSPGCSQQLDLYQSELEEFERRGAQILAVSVDSIYSHGAWAAVRELDFPLLADFHPKGDVARTYGVFRDSDGFSERALYVIDADGIIRYAHVAPWLHHVPDIYELVAALDDLTPAQVGRAPA